LRILFANPIGALGGAELFLLEILQELRCRASDWNLHLVAGGDGPLLQRAAELGVTCHLQPFPAEISGLGDSSAHDGATSRLASTFGLVGRLLRSGSAGYSYLRRLRRLVDQVSPDIVHSNGLKFHGLTGLAGCGRAKLSWLMHDYLGSRRLLSRALPRVAGSVNLIWANSQSVAADTRLLMPTKRIEVLYCGIDLNEFAPGPGDGAWLDQQCGQPPRPSHELRIGLVATYARWKGQDVFLRAAAELVRRNPDVLVRFYIVGGPIYQTAGSQFSVEELRRLASDLGIADVVSFAPFQSDIARVFRSLDIVVHASRHPEPFGRTILEAMACARAVIATQAGGAAEIFTPGEDALGARPDHVGDLTNALDRLVRDQSLRQTLAKNARETASRFSRQRMGEQIFHTYRALGDSQAETRCQPQSRVRQPALQLDAEFKEPVP
jgi:glycosyltransferase involved in cell wall biosynthesis